MAFEDSACQWPFLPRGGRHLPLGPRGPWRSSGFSVACGQSRELDAQAAPGGVGAMQLVGLPRSVRGGEGGEGTLQRACLRGNGEFDKFLFALFLASKSMQEGWGSGGDDMSLGPSQWDDEEGGVWNSAASQESSSSCSSWGNAPKKGLQKVCAPERGTNRRLTHSIPAA